MFMMRFPQSQLQRGILTVAIVFALLTAVTFALNLSLSTTGKLKDIAAIVQSSVAAAAIVTGGIFAYYKLQLFRDFKPHLTISHNISHRILSDSYMHIDVTATLHKVQGPDRAAEGLFALAGSCACLR